MSRALMTFLFAAAVIYGVPDDFVFTDGYVCVWNLVDEEGRHYHKCRHSSDNKWVIYYDDAAV